MFSYPYSCEDVTIYRYIALLKKSRHSSHKRTVSVISFALCSDSIRVESIIESFDSIGDFTCKFVGLPTIIIHRLVCN